jgi:deoxyribodipyrimidine photo-lyase
MSEVERESARVPLALRGLMEDARVTVRRGGAPAKGGRCVVYWMQRAQRGVDNHALDIAVRVGNALGLPVVVFFAGSADAAGASARHAAFAQQGLRDVEATLRERGVGFVLRGAPRDSVEKFLTEVRAAMVVGDENPLRAHEQARRELAKCIAIPFWTVDADVVVPSRLMDRAQYAARTIRPRLYRLLPEFLVPFENPRAEREWKRPRGLAAERIEDVTRGWMDLDRSVEPVQAWVGGTQAGMARLKLFTSKLLRSYERDRNRPEVDGTSALSPYLRFGHVGPLTIALAVEHAAKRDASLKSARDAYFNELIVWRELAVNFVRYTARYDSATCAEAWAKKTIGEHARDERERLYTLRELEQGETHDDLWNAAQRQMVRFGWMHNVMRMYWAKKILEWTPSVRTAMKWAIYLNDKYELDGRDPNGYAGIAWSMVGKFDRAWSERAVFGKIRYMSPDSTGRKFDSKHYVQQMSQL